MQIPASLGLHQKAHSSDGKHDASVPSRILLKHKITMILQKAV